MVNNDKTRLMTKCAIFEKNEGAMCIENSKYTMATYICIRILKNILLYSIAFMLIAGLYSLHTLESVVKVAFSSAVRTMISRVIILYCIMIVLIIVISIIVYRRQYIKQRKMLGIYNDTLDKINNLSLQAEAVEELRDNVGVMK